MNRSQIKIQPLKSLAEMHPAVELQKTYWGENLESIIPAHMLYSLANHGGHVLAAFDDRRMVGLLVGFLATSSDDSPRPAMANLEIFSKRMIVLDDHRGQGIGYRLKLAQREIAIRQGIRLVTWTFDPLLAINAHLNVRKLGAVCQTYLDDYYGISDEGGLTMLGSSDRLIAEWWVTNRRVEERINGKRGDLTLKHYLQAMTPILNPTSVRADGLPLPSDGSHEPSGSLALLEIPTDYRAMVRQDAELAVTWRRHTRALFKQVIVKMGFMVTDFIHEPYEGRERAFYMLSYNGPGADTTRLN
jgi:predicted GNAT superfamily acetyltransferase